MADLRPLKRKVVAHGRAIHDRAINDYVRRGLDDRVPVDTGATKFSRRIVTVATDTKIRSTVTYPGKLPVWLDEGTPPHTIVGRPLLVFFWKKVGRTVYLRKVRHPGSRKHKGWFSKWMTAPKWKAALRAARR